MNKRSLALPSALVLAVAAVACGYPEQRVIDQYFNAVNAQDTQTLSSFAAVKFDKKVSKWSILGASAETKTPATLPDLVKKVNEIQKGIDDNKKEANSYALNHLSDVDEVRELTRKEAKIPARLSGVAAEWEKFNQKNRELTKALQEAKEAVDSEKRDTQLSVGDIADIDTLPGEVSSKTFDLQLTIDGQPQNWVMELKKYDLQTTGTGRVMARWFIHTLQPKS